MTRQEYLLIVLAEEAAEVTQAVTKIVRFGMHNVYGGELNNLQKLQTEVADLQAMVELLDLKVDRGAILDKKTRILKRLNKEFPQTEEQQ